MSNVNNIDIDLVYLWVDGSDPDWQEKRNMMLKKENRPLHELKGRFDNNDELKYSIRSIEKYAPWIRNIYIVTDNQIPSWLNTDNPKVKIVDHKDIMPSKSLPCFNSGLIEYFIYKITGLSEHFIFANDDAFINKDVNKSFFFDKDEQPIVRLLFRPLLRIESIIKKNSRKSNHKLSVENARKIFYKKYKKNYFAIMHHNMDAYRKSDFKNIVEIEYRDVLSQIYQNHFRMPTNIQRLLINLHLVHNKLGHLKYVRRKESMRIKVHKGKFQQVIERYNPTLFCLNDTEYSTDADRTHIQPFLEGLFPNKSSFEK